MLRYNRLHWARQNVQRQSLSNHAATVTWAARCILVVCWIAASCGYDSRWLRMRWRLTHTQHTAWLLACSTCPAWEIGWAQILHMQCSAVQCSTVSLVADVHTSSTESMLYAGVLLRPQDDL
jgi:hypothetical protein